MSEEINNARTKLLVHFSNKSQLGAFGEFVYKKYCESLGLDIERTNFCHTDFILHTKDINQFYYIDVKSTLSDKKKYKGKRYHKDIVYEMVLVLEDKVFLVSDHNSPFQTENRQYLGELLDWIDKWKKNTEIVHKRTSRLDDSIIKELKDLFTQIQCPRVRMVERGDASSKRWTGTVDNLPGSPKVVDGADVTVFFEFGCEDFKERLSRIFLIWHRLLRTNDIKMLKPNNRQTKKGIKEVIDLCAFSNDYPNLVFDNLDNLKSYLGNEV